MSEEPQENLPEQPAAPETPEETGEQVSLETAFQNLLVAATTNGDVKTAREVVDTAYETTESAQARSEIARAFAEANISNPDLFAKVNYFGAIRGSKVYRDALEVFVTLEDVEPDALQSANILLGGVLRRSEETEDVEHAEEILKVGAEHFSHKYGQEQKPEQAVECSRAEYDLSFVHYNRGVGMQDTDEQRVEFNNSLACLDRASAWDKKAGKPASAEQTLTRRGALQLDHEMVSPSESRDWFEESRKNLKSLGGSGDGAEASCQTGSWYLNATNRKLGAVQKIGDATEARELFEEIKTHPIFIDWIGGEEAAEKFIAETEQQISALE